MGTPAATEIDAWLRQGGIVVTASERAARAVASAYNRTRQAEGLTAWETPNIQDWNRFVRSAWGTRTADGRLVLNAAQEQAVWAEIAAADGRLATLLEGPRYRLAGLAKEAHGLICSHAPEVLRGATRSGWGNDAASFSRWLTAFDEACRTGSLLSPARLPIELLRILEAGPSEPRPPLLLVGFDRILPVQRAVFNAWGDWQEAVPPDPATRVVFFQAADDKAELAACARWCSQTLAANPAARILVITQDATTRRGEMERAFLSLTGPAAPPVFEFSLGVPLSRIAVVRAAHMLLRWLSGSLAEHELDWLFSTGHAGAAPEESSALQAHMRSLRSRGLEQPSWSLSGFQGSIPSPHHEQPDLSARPPLASWTDRMTQSRRRLDEARRQPRTPLEWAELTPQLLAETGWPGARATSSLEFQALNRWQQALETAASLGFDGQRIDWKGFLSLLARTLEETLFAPESLGAPILIAGPAESAGLDADAIWFLGATEEAWPAGGAMHPLLPVEVQRDAEMPHATPQLDWDLAHTLTQRLLASGGEVIFSCAAQTNGTEARPSPLIVEHAGPPEPLPAALAPLPAPDPITVLVEESEPVAYPGGLIAGGSAVLTAQSQCGFRAFATARLGAQRWNPAEAGLTPSQRGQLLHDVLHSVWAGQPRGIRSHAELKSIADIKQFVFNHVQEVFEATLRPALRDRMPPRYLRLEQDRLVRLVTEWLQYESTRVPFDVLETEASHEVELAGLTFKLRLDRMDRLNDGSVLVIDYKSGLVNPKSWELPRPDDVQLPLYAGFALDDNQELGGLAFARVRPGDLAFAGCVGDPVLTLFSDLKGGSALAKNAMTAEKLLGWKENIEQLAQDFVAGRAAIDPRDAPRTCDRCGLHTLCRIQETLVTIGTEEVADEAEDDDA
jgi:ATP-dependent helicase/nuclease subunit B